MSKSITRTTYPINLSRQHLFDLCRMFSHLPGTSLLASGGDHPAAQISYLGLFPNHHFTLTLPPENASIDPWKKWQEGISFSYHDPYPEWVGFLTYEVGAYSDPEKIIDRYAGFMPDICFYRPTCWIRYDHIKDQILLILDPKEFVLLTEEHQKIIQQLINGEPFITAPKESQFSSFKLENSSDDFDTYIHKILQIKENIADGSVYQVNLSQQHLFKGRGDPFDLYQKFFEYNPTPFSAYLQTAEGTVISLSPERLLSKQGSHLETRPIKGTVPRGASPKEDEANQRLLEDSSKEKAELMMITDLMRNDLARISRRGTVKVQELRHCQAYSHVFHMESVITSEVDPEKSVFDILRICFPGGSVTGCPKLSAMEKIYAMEQRPRGIYTGSIGYMCGNGDFDFSIAIRTLWHSDEVLNLQLGGAIVIDSDPKKEYEETVHKGKSLLTILQASY